MWDSRVPTGCFADRATSSLPRTGSEDKHDHDDDDDKDESGDGDRAGAHGVSEPVGINWRPYSIPRTGGSPRRTPEPTGCPWRRPCCRAGRRMTATPSIEAPCTSRFGVRASVSLVKPHTLASATRSRRRSGSLTGSCSRARTRSRPCQAPPRLTLDAHFPRRCYRNPTNAVRCFRPVRQSTRAARSSVPHPFVDRRQVRGQQDSRACAPTRVPPGRAGSGGDVHRSRSAAPRRGSRFVRGVRPRAGSKSRKGVWGPAKRPFAEGGEGARAGTRTHSRLCRSRARDARQLVHLSGRSGDGAACESARRRGSETAPRPPLLEPT
jgi:hypothetical protein